MNEISRPNSLDAYWMPFSDNKYFKGDTSRMLARAALYRDAYLPASDAMKRLADSLRPSPVAATLFARAQPKAPDGGERAGSTDWLWLSLSRAGRTADAQAMLDQHVDAKPDPKPAPPGYPS